MFYRFWEVYTVGTYHPKATRFDMKNEFKDLPIKYLRKESNGNVAVYADEECTKLFCYWPSQYSSKPKHNTKRIMIDCALYAVKWVK